jgi:small-conductance mechanosensitive channel
MNNTTQKKPICLLQLGVLLVALWIISPCSVGGISLWAAEPAKSPPPASETKQTPPQPVAIIESEIIPRAEQTLRSLQETRFELAADSDLALISLEKEISAFAEKSDRRWQGQAQAIGASRSLQDLNDDLRQWSVEQSQLDRWDRALARRSQILVGHEDEVRKIYETWEATRQAGRRQGFPKVALQKIAEVLREADAVRGLIRAAMAKLLGLQIQLANRREALAKIRGDIDKAREASGRQLFVLDGPPLWRAIFTASESRDVILVQAIQSSQRFAEDLLEFGKKYRERILWHAVYFVALVLLFRFLRRDATAQAVEPLDDAALFVLDRPWPTSLLLALIAGPLFYPEAPAAVLRIAVVLTGIPVINLLPSLLPKIFRHGVYWLVAIYAVNFLRHLLPVDWLVARLLLLEIAASGCIGIGLFLRRRGAQLSTLGSRERFVLPAIRFICFLFAASVVSNLVGNGSLAEILVDIPARIVYSAALIFFGAHLLSTLVMVALRSRPAQWLRSAREHGGLIARRCRALIRLTAILSWATISLYMAGVLGDIFAAGLNFLELRFKLGAAEISVQDLAAFIAVFLGAVLFSRLLRFVLAEEILPRIRLPRGVPGAVDVLCRYGVLLLGFLIALAAAGVDFSRVTLLISALGVGIGFGLQNLVNNFVSGLILVFEHPIQVGDHVDVGSLYGEVRKIGFRASILRTPDGADVIVPNSELIGSRVINWSLSDQLRRISIPVSVAYGTDPNRVMGLLVGVARKHPKVLADPAPAVVFERFGDSALSFTLLCWSFVDAWFFARSELTIAINSAFKEAGIQIPFPQQDVHLHWPEGESQGDRAMPVRDPVEGKSAEPATLASARGSQLTK